ncbi:MAG: Do family serine endopeptidase [Methylococcales bacterium]|nr:Do family serine endopeptidase [Methylococcales bacterium]
MKTNIGSYFLAIFLLTMLAAGLLPINAWAFFPIENNPLPEMLKKVVPGVVNISTRTRISYEESPLFRDPFFRQFFDIPNMKLEREQQSLGSGVIVDASKGYVVTNHHVINKADKITVTLQGGQSFDAKLVGSDQNTDVALIKINSDKLVELSKGDSDVLQVGDFVVAIGSPFGLGQTVTSGIVSALGRTSLGIEGYEDFIQTDASINPGNSGGALVNLKGELIGINTAIVGPSGGNVGIGFAIPINLANQVIKQIIQFGDIKRGQLGIQMQDLTPSLASAFNVKQQKGIVISGIIPNSPAAKAGLQRGDIVTAVNGQEVDSTIKLSNRIALMLVGDVVDLQILRDGEAINKKARVAKALAVIER